MDERAARAATNGVRRLRAGIAKGSWGYHAFAAALLAAVMAAVIGVLSLITWLIPGWPGWVVVAVVFVVGHATLTWWLDPKRKMHPSWHEKSEDVDTP